MVSNHCGHTLSTSWRSFCLRILDQKSLDLILCCHSEKIKLLEFMCNVFCLQLHAGFLFTTIICSFYVAFTVHEIYLTFASV